MSWGMSQEAQSTSCHSAPTPEEESEFVAQFLAAPYTCQSDQLDHELGGGDVGDCSSMYWTPGHGACCYWLPNEDSSSSAGARSISRGGYFDGCCYYVGGEPDVSLGINTLPCTSIDLNLVGNCDSAAVLSVASQPKRKTTKAGKEGGELGRRKKAARTSENNKQNQGKKAQKLSRDNVHSSSSSSSWSGNESNCSQENQGTAGDHVAGGGKAKDRASQSLYARKRRERISGRLRILQKLVPNGTKVDLSTMLEEAVHYVKFLQLQIKMLSSDEMWMYAPIYNGVNLGMDLKISPLQ